MIFRPALASAALLAAASPAWASVEQDAFFDNLSALCGKAFAGELVSKNARDSDMAGKALVMHVRECGDTEIRVPFHVGDDHSRTWVITRTGAGLRLKHDHRHADGSPDAVTMYGGDTVTAGSAERQEFPADEESKTMFRANDLAVSVDNIWAVEVKPGAIYAYELRRDDRHFRVEFDLTAPLAELPPAPWGSETP